MSAPSIQPERAEPESGAFIIDFGRGSREQTQGGPTRNENNVHPIRMPANAATARG